MVKQSHFRMTGNDAEIFRSYDFYFEWCCLTSSHQSFHRAHRTLCRRGHGAAEMQAMPSSFDARSGRGEIPWSVPFVFEFLDFKFSETTILYPARWVSIPCVLVASTLQCLLGGRWEMQYSKFGKVWRHAAWGKNRNGDCGVFWRQL